MLVSGKQIAAKINSKTKRLASALKKRGIIPKLGVVLVGNDSASLTYVRQKEKAARTLGIDFELHHFPAVIKQEELAEKIGKIQEDIDLSGLIIQLPLPTKLFKPQVLDALAPALDVDFLSSCSLGQILMNANKLNPPTPGAILAILKDLKIDLEGKDVVVIGAGDLVGRPLFNLLMREKATVTSCNAATKNLQEKCLNADIIISCAGKKDLVRSNMVKEGAVVIDAGFSFVDGKSYGDVNLEEVSQKASFVTPTPGGVGPITVALLLYNTVKKAEMKLT